MHTSIYAACFPVPAQVLLAAPLAAALMALDVLIGKRMKYPVKDTSYECGIPHGRPIRTLSSGI